MCFILKSFISSNWFWIIIISITLFFAVLVNNGQVFLTYLITITQLIVALFLTVTFHEIGHVLAGKLQGYKVVLVTTVFGMYLNNKWLWNISISSAAGYTLVSKSRLKGKVKKKELFFFYIGGILANITLIIIFSFVDFMIITDFPFLTYLIFCNYIIILVTAIPFEGTDGMRVLKLLKNENELLYFQAVSDSFDTSLSSEDIISIHSTNELSSEYSHFISTLAAIEKLSADQNNYQDIISITSNFDDKLLDNIIIFYKICFKFLDNQALTEDDYKFLKDVNDDYGVIIILMKSYILTKNKEYIEEIKSNMFFSNDFIQKNIILNMINILENSLSKTSN